MVLKMLLPSISRTVERVVVVRWHKAEGDGIEYGDHLVDVEVRSITKMKRIHDANRVLRRLRSRVAAGQAEFSSVEVDALVRITSADFGTLEEIHSRVGDVLRPGELLAICASELGAESAGAAAGTAELRTTASFLESP